MLFGVCLFAILCICFFCFCFCFNDWLGLSCGHRPGLRLSFGFRLCFGFCFGFGLRFWLLFAFLFAFERVNGIQSRLQRRHRQAETTTNRQVQRNQSQTTTNNKPFHRCIARLACGNKELKQLNSYNIITTNRDERRSLQFVVQPTER